MKKVTVAHHAASMLLLRLYVKYAAAASMGLHVNMTAHVATTAMNTLMLLLLLLIN